MNATVTNAPERRPRNRRRFVSRILAACAITLPATRPAAER
ncbi:hypothetical protein ACQP0C_01885 [Nocardia sp. CA-129566]